MIVSEELSAPPVPVTPSPLSAGCRHAEQSEPESVHSLAGRRIQRPYPVRGRAVVLLIAAGILRFANDAP